MSTQRFDWYNHELIFPMGLRKTANWERAAANGDTLDDTCPLHSWPAPRAFSEEWRDGVLILTFHPCEHRGYPQWDGRRGASRWLSSPIAQPPRRRKGRR